MPADPLLDRNLYLLWRDLCGGADPMGLLRRVRPRWQACGELLLRLVQVQISALVLSQSYIGHSEYGPIFDRVGDCRGLRADVWSDNWGIRCDNSYDTNHALCYFLRRSLALSSM